MIGKSKPKEVENDNMDDESIKFDRQEYNESPENDQTVVIELDKKSQSEESGIRMGENGGMSEKNSKKGRSGHQ